MINFCRLYSDCDFAKSNQVSSLCGCTIICAGGLQPLQIHAYPTMEWCRKCKCGKESTKDGLRPQQFRKMLVWVQDLSKVSYSNYSRVCSQWIPTQPFVPRISSSNKTKPSRKAHKWWYFASQQCSASYR